MSYIELPDRHRWATDEEKAQHETDPVPHSRWVHGEIGYDLAVEIPTPCASCEEDMYESDDDVQWSNVLEDMVCYSCYENDLSYVSVITFYGPEPLGRYEDRHKIYVGDITIMDQYGDEPDVNVTRTYHRTDGWRGYQETRIEGWSEVTSGWTTGNWGDYTGQRKATFNEWAEALHDGEILPPCEVAIIADPTSNVFSTAIGVWVRDEDMDTFMEWLGEGMLEDLEEALG